MHSVLAIMVLTLQASAAPQAGPPSTEELVEAWARVGPSIASMSPVPVTLNRQDFETISNARIAKRRIREAGPDRALGAMWVPIERNKIWVAILDDIHDHLLSSLTETRLGVSDQGHKLLYQHLDLPWPAQNRQMVIEIQNNLPISTSTDGMLWERSWTLAEPSLMKQADASAVWVPMTNGAWLLFPVQDGTVVVYHARSTIGGRIPDELVTRWAMATLDEMMLHIVDRAGQIRDHYTAAHEIIIGGDEKPIPYF